MGEPSGGVSGCLSGGALISTGFLFAVVGAIAYALANARRTRAPWRYLREEGMNLSNARSLRVYELRLAFDWRARCELQETLTRLASSHDVETAEGRVRLLHQTCDMVMKHEASWTHAFTTHQKFYDPDEAQRCVREMASDARTKFQIETIRADEYGGVNQRPEPVLPMAFEKERGFLVLTLIAGLEGRRAPLPKGATRASIKKALARLGTIETDGLATIEVVWAPSVKDEIMSEKDLAANYAELKSLGT